MLFIAVRMLRKLPTNGGGRGAYVSRLKNIKKLEVNNEDLLKIFESAINKGLPA